MACGVEATASLTRKIGGIDPSHAQIDAEIGTTPAPFDPGDLKRIACWESSGWHQFRSDNTSLLGPTGDVGIFQICYQRRSYDFWDWKRIVASGKLIPNGSKSAAAAMPQRVRTKVVRGLGPFPDATPFTDSQVRLEAIHRYHTGTNPDLGYWQWNDQLKQWVASPNGGMSGYVASVLSKSPSCP